MKIGQLISRVFAVVCWIFSPNKILIVKRRSERSRGLTAQKHQKLKFQCKSKFKSIYLDWKLGGMVCACVFAFRTFSHVRMIYRSALKQLEINSTKFILDDHTKKKKKKRSEP